MAPAIDPFQAEVGQTEPIRLRQGQHGLIDAPWSRPVWAAGQGNRSSDRKATLRRPQYECESRRIDLKMKAFTGAIVAGPLLVLSPRAVAPAQATVITFGLSDVTFFG
jgi:hypothetical protein